MYYLIIFLYFRLDVVFFVDVFDIYDNIYGLVFGCYDGNVYERMLKLI